MQSVNEVAVLALRPLLGGACRAVGFEVGQAAVEGVAGLLEDRLRDPSRKASRALARSTERAWRAVEVALAGEGLLACFDRADDRAFRAGLRAYLEAGPLGPFPDDFRPRCHAELKAARRAGLLAVSLDTPGAVAEVARAAAAFARQASPLDGLREEGRLIDDLAGRLRQAGYPALGDLVALRPNNGPGVLAQAVRFFFHHEVTNNEEIFRGLAYEQIDRLGHDLEQGFRSVNAALEGQGERLAGALDEVKVVVARTHDAVLDVQAELRRQGEESRRQLEGLYQAVQALQARLNLAGRPVRPGDSLALRGEAERRQVRDLAQRCETAAAGQPLPALLNAVGQLEVAAGEFGRAEEDFRRVARLTADPAARGEARYNAYRAALEQGRLPEACQLLREAAESDPARFAPFPLNRYEPLRILGAGGFGVTFHCRYRPTGGDVAVKVLAPDGLDQDVGTVFREAEALDRVRHPAVVRLRECDYAEGVRPYLVMEYFDGPTLEARVRDGGPLAVCDWRALAGQMAGALREAHARGVLHRDVKPANVLLRPAPGGGWEVRLIDFGLAVKQDLLNGAAPSSQTMIGASIAGTIDYAAPEQLGKRPGTRVGPAADVYGFGRTCCYALFGTPAPLPSQWSRVPPEVTALLEACLADDPARRLPDFDAVLARLEAPGADLPLAVRVDRDPLPVARAAKDAAPLPVARQAPPPLPVATLAPPEPAPPAPPARPARRPGPVRWALPRGLSALLGAGLWLGLMAAGDRPRGFEWVVAVTAALVIGGTGGALVRSARGWAFVLAVAGLGTTAFTASGPRPVALATGLTVGWALAVVVKVALWLRRLVAGPGRA